MNSGDTKDILIRASRPRLRSAAEADIDAATGILRAAANRMLAEGKQQWNNGVK